MTASFPSPRWRGGAPEGADEGAFPPPASRAAARWDAALKRAVAINGISGLCITKFDGMEKLKMCSAYEYRGKCTE
ncbi:adenylosuccinate synthase [Luteimonas cucumeris]|uniref:Adenylosuccinate synthase n=1 Tax=Luteimonas cucumeris TaxID=985012 RepID=A0A562LEP3_9GAMM|nr:adenylosuccinate synthase [Luteimonas cucumeris]